MATGVVMPQLGESVTEGTLIKWLVTPGTKVTKYQPICEIMTDKVSAEVPSSVTGIVTELVAAEGETIPVGGLICYMEEQGNNELERPQPQTQIESPSNTVPSKPMHSEQHTLSPAVLHMAREHGVDLSKVNGTGKGGRITRKDMINYINNRNETIEQVRIEEPKLSVPLSVPTHITKAISSAWMMIEVDVTDLIAHCSQVNKEFEQKQGLKLTYLPFFIHAVITSLKQYPALNSTLDGDRIVEPQNLNLAVDVLSDNKLYSPVIRNADRLNLFGIAQSLQDFAYKAAARKLSDLDQSEGTFSIMNSGEYGSIESQPNIHYPQAAVLSIEKITKRPVIIDDMFAARSMVNLCLAYDERVLDRLTCGLFLQKIKNELETKCSAIPLY